MKELKQFQISIVQVSILVLLAVAPILVFQLCIDPYGVFFRLYDHSPTEPNKRYIKIKHILNHPDKFDSFIFGNSRVNAFCTDQFPEGKFYNMSYSIGVPANHLEEIIYLLHKGIKIKRLIIALDHTSLIENNVVKEDDLLRKKYPMNLVEKVKFYSSYIFSIPSKEFVQTVLSGSQHDWSLLDEHGYIESKNNTYKLDPINHVQGKGFQEKLVYLDRVPNIQRNMASIREIKKLADKEGIQLTFILNPVFHTAFTTIHLPAYYASLRQLASFTPFFDFSGIHTETLDKCNYHESSHYTSALAAKMTKIIFSKKRLSHFTFGTYVDQQNLENQIEAHFSALAMYFRSKNLLEPLYNHHPHTGSGAHMRTSINKARFHEKKDTILISSPIFELKIEVSGKLDPTNLRIQANGKNIPLCNIEADEVQSALSKNIWSYWIEAKHLGEGNHTLQLIQKQQDLSFVMDSITVQILGVEGMTFHWKKCLPSDSTTLGNLDQVYFVPFKEGHEGKELKGIVNLEGWLATSPSKLPADEIYVHHNGHLYPVHFTLPRPDVHQLLSVPESNQYGFYGTIPVYREDIQRNQFQFWLIDHQEQKCQIFYSK